MDRWVIMLTGTEHRAREVAEARGWRPVWPADATDLQRLDAIELWMDTTLGAHPRFSDLADYLQARLRDDLPEFWRWRLSR